MAKDPFDLTGQVAIVTGSTRGIGLAITKAGIAQLVRNLAVQWGQDGIRANTVSPALIRTAISEPLLADTIFRQRRLEMPPLRRVGEVEDVAGCALFLTSEAASFVTCHNLVVDGGTTITDGS